MTDEIFRLFNIPDLCFLITLGFQFNDSIYTKYLNISPIRLIFQRHSAD